MSVLNIPLSNLNITAKTVCRVALLLMMSVAITACGFHLRGNIPLAESVKSMYLNAPDGTFKEELEDLLIGAEVQFFDTRGGAEVVLSVTKALSDRTVGTLDDRGKVDSYNLRLRVVYTVNDAEGNVLRAKTNLNATRQYNFSAEQVVQSESEEAELLSSMEEEIALKMLRQLSAITDDPLSNPIEKK